MSIDTIANFLSALKNAYMRNKESIEVSNSRVISDICKVLKLHGFISDYKVFKKEKFKYIHIDLGYKEGKPALLGLRQVSKPGRRVYLSYDKLRPVLSGLGISIITTSRGVVSGKEAKKKKLGGEVICEVW